MANHLVVLGPLPSVNESLPIMNVDLSTFSSDGTGRYPPGMTRPDERAVLDLLIQVFNMHGYGSRLFGKHRSSCLLLPQDLYMKQGHNINFVGSLPRGYAAFKYTTPAGHTMIELWGHPSRRPFISFEGFSVHIISIMTASLDQCRCPLCISPWPEPGELAWFFVRRSGHHS